MALKIGALARAAGTTAPTVRYYEAIGLLPRADRRAGGQRDYGDADARRLTFIRRCRDFGFPIDQVRSLVDLMQDRGRPCAEARALAQDRLDGLRAKLVELRALEATIAGLVAACDATCKDGGAPDCVILNDFAGSFESALTRRERLTRTNARG
jgi:DNA-binding transcriptional MerR regulator